MNIIEAIKSGKAFKRTIWTRDYVRPPFMTLNLSAEELLANDWEVEEKKITITESEFDGIVEHILAEWEYSKPESPHRVLITALSGLKKELGL